MLLREEMGKTENGKHIFQPRRLFTSHFMAFGRKLLVGVERIAREQSGAIRKSRKKNTKTIAKKEQFCCQAKFNKQTSKLLNSRVITHQSDPRLPRNSTAGQSVSENAAANQGSSIRRHFHFDQLCHKPHLAANKSIRYIQVSAPDSSLADVKGVSNLNMQLAARLPREPKVSTPQGRLESP